MRTMFKTAITGTLAILLLGTLCVSKATALCGYAGGHRATVQPQHWQGPAQFRPASFLLVADKGSDHRIVGFWKVEIVSEGSRGKLFRLSGAFRLARKRQWKERQQG